MIDIGQMVRSANPVPAEPALTDDELDGLLHLIDTRRENMVVKEKLAPVKPPAPKRSPWLVAAAAFVAVLVIGAAALLLTLPGDNDSSPATPTETTLPPTPTTNAPETTVATTTPEVEDTGAASVDVDAAVAAVSAHIGGFVDAVNAGVAGEEIVSLYFPTEDEVGCGPVVDASACDSPALWSAPSRYPALGNWFDHLVAIDTVYEIGECRAVDDHGTVTCDLQSTSLYEPFHPDQRLEEFSLRFNGDAIDYAALNDVDIFEWGFAEVEFEAWLRDNHPDVAELMYSAAGANGFPAPKITSGSEVFSENLIEYVPLWRDATEGP